MTSKHCIPVTNLPSLTEATIEQVIQDVETANFVQANKNVMMYGKLNRMISSEQESDDLFPVTAVELTALSKEGVGKTVSVDKDLYLKIKEQYLLTHRLLNLDMRNVFRIKKLDREQSHIFLSELGLPRQLLDLKPTISIQMIRGNGLTPHIDFDRQASLYYLLTEHTSNWVTSWYDYADKTAHPRDPHGYGFTWVTPDPDKLILKESHYLKRGQWYIFDNITYHGISTGEEYSPLQKRVAISVEFRVSVEELDRILKSI